MITQRYTRMLGLALALCTALIQLQAQVQLQGTVADSISGAPLPFATLALSGSPYGTTSDQDGYFTLSLNNTSPQDSVEVNYIGYALLRLPLSDLLAGDTIWLSPASALLDALIVRPLSPEAYLRQVKRKLKDNTAIDSYNAVSRYEEKVTENQQYIGHNEGKFKSWHSAHQPGAKHQHQLALYRKEDLTQLQFMERKARKEKEKYLKENPDKADQFEEGQLFATNFGGPGMIQRLNLYSSTIAILDSTQHQRFEMRYEADTRYMDRPMTVIYYETKGKLDDRRFSGRIYIDKVDDAIVHISESGEFVIPVLARPVLMAMGFKVRETAYALELKLRPIDDRWYPQYTHWDIYLDVTKKYMFSKNDHAKFRLSQELETELISTEQVSKIPEGLRFDSNEKMSTQVHPIEGLKW